MHKKTYLVTGAAGFIGSAVAQKLIHDGHNVVTIDNLSTGKKENLPSGIKFLEGDCADKKIIDQLKVYNFDAILHIAGQSSGEISFENPAYDLNTNTLSSLLLLKLASEIGCKKFIYASSMSIYGNQPDSPVYEDAILNPVSFYSVGKMASEKYMNIYSKFGISNTALRLFNVYGPGQNLENMKQGMVSIYLAQALESRKIIVKGSPDRYRDFVYIDDVVNTFIASIGLEEPGFNFYNVATGVRTTVSQLLNMITVNFDEPIEIQYIESTPGDQFGIYGNSDKFKNIFGNIICTNLDNGLTKMIGWAKNEY